MTIEMLLLCSLIFVFIVSFCGLLQKIKQSYERERIIAERMARRHTTRDPNSDAYINSTFVEDFDSGTGIFPGAPPPYSHLDEPPKYEDIVKIDDCVIRIEPTAPSETERVNSSPPPYTITT